MRTSSTDPSKYLRTNETKRKIGGQKEVLNAWFCSYKTEIYHFDAVVHCALFNGMAGSMKMMRKRKEERDEGRRGTGGGIDGDGRTTHNSLCIYYCAQARRNTLAVVHFYWNMESERLSCLNCRQQLFSVEVTAWAKVYASLCCIKILCMHEFPYKFDFSKGIILRDKWECERMWANGARDRVILTTPSPMWCTVHGKCAFAPICVLMVVEFSVPKYMGSL